MHANASRQEGARSEWVCMLAGNVLSTVEAEVGAGGVNWLSRGRPHAGLAPARRPAGGVGPLRANDRPSDLSHSPAAHPATPYSAVCSSKRSACPSARTCSSVQRAVTGSGSPPSLAQGKPPLQAETIPEGRTRGASKDDAGARHGREGRHTAELKCGRLAPFGQLGSDRAPAPRRHVCSATLHAPSALDRPSPPFFLCQARQPCFALPRAPCWGR